MKYLILLSLFIVGCVITHKLTSKSYPAKPENCKIDILTQKPDRAFEEIILLKTKTKKDNYKLRLEI